MEIFFYISWDNEIIIVIFYILETLELFVNITLNKNK